MNNYTFNPRLNPTYQVRYDIVTGTTVKPNEWYNDPSRPMKISATSIAANLWQGSVPPFGTALRDAGFEVLILCAREHQPRPSAKCYPGIFVIHAPNRDDYKKGPTPAEWMGAMDAARIASYALVKGRRVLITCMQGRNRSGLVTALTLRNVYGMSGKDATAVVQGKIVRSLENPTFMKRLAGLDDLAPEQCAAYQIRRDRAVPRAL